MTLNKAEKEKEMYVSVIKDALPEIFTPEKFKEHLDRSVYLNHLSVSNQILVGVQNPNATHIASYQAWEEMGRQVERGEKSLKVLAPSTAYKNGAYEQVFAPVSMFDISQTKGSPIPLLSISPSDNPRDAYNLLSTLEQVSPVPVEYKSRLDVEELQPPSYHGDTIVIDNDLPLYEKCKNLLREIGMYKTEDSLASASVAYVVGKRFGVDIQPDFSPVSTLDGDAEYLRSYLKGINDAVKNMLAETESLLPLEQEKNADIDIDSIVKEQDERAKRTEEKLQKKKQENIKGNEEEKNTEISPEQEEELKKIEKQYKKGLLTFEEAEKKKAEVLGTKAEEAPKKEEKPKRKRTNKIDDFGEKIGGAKKDRRMTLKKALGDELYENVTKTAKLSVLWPKPDYEQMIKDGVPRETAYLVYRAREMFPNTPRYPKDLIYKASDGSFFFNKDRIVNEMEREQNYYAKCVLTTKAICDVILKDEFRNNYHECASSLLDGLKEHDVWTPYSRFNTYTPYSDIYVIKCIADNDRSAISANILRSNFCLSEEEKEERARIYPNTKEKKEAYVSKYHDGNVTGKDLVDTFGLKGGEFGSSMTKLEKQNCLNRAYDGFKELAMALNISDKDISLGGELSIAFGSRGKKGAKAHYEPVKKVINLTKDNADGSLAHEWMHAMDYLLNEELCGQTNVPRPLSDGGTGFKNFVAPGIRDILMAMRDSRNKHPELASENLDVLLSKKEALAAEIIAQSESISDAKKIFGWADGYIRFNRGALSEVSDETFKDKVEINKDDFELAAVREMYTDICSYIDNCNAASSNDEYSDFYGKSQEIDKRMGTFYWSTDREMFARAGSAYVADKLNEMGIPSDYLCRDTGVDPEGDERKAVDKAFGYFFQNMRAFEIFEPNQEQEKSLDAVIESAEQKVTDSSPVYEQEEVR